MSLDTKEANEPHVHQNNKCDKMICEMSKKLREEFSKMSSRIKELEEQLSASSQKCQETEQEVSRKSNRIKQLEEELSFAKQNCHETEQQVLRMSNRIEELEEQRSIATQKCHETEQEEDDSSADTEQAGREHRIGVQLKNIRERLHKDVTSLLQMSELKVELDHLTKLSERLQNLYSDIEPMIADTCSCSEDLKRDLHDFAYYGLRAEHNDLAHRVEDLEYAQKGMSEEETEAFKILQELQVNRRGFVDKLDKLENIFKLPERLPKTPMSEPAAADKQSDGKKVMRHTDPGAKPKKPKEVTVPTSRDDSKSDEVRLNFMTQKSKFKSLTSPFRRKESGENQCSGVSYTPRRDS